MLAFKERTDASCCFSQATPCLTIGHVPVQSTWHSFGTVHQGFGECTVSAPDLTRFRNLTIRIEQNWGIACPVTFVWIGTSVEVLVVVLPVLHNVW